MRECKNEYCDRDIQIIKYGYCSRCYNYWRLHDKEDWAPKIHEPCILGCTMSTVSKRFAPINGKRRYQALCRLHLNRVINRRFVGNWICSNENCINLPKLGLNECADCIANGENNNE